MNIDKIKNYNVKMLAVLSTILVLLGGIGLITVLTFIIGDIMPRNNTNNANDLLADSRVEQLAKDSLRQQIVSYDNPQLVDTANLVYVIPVNVKTLDSPEGVGGVLDMFESPSSSRMSTFKHRRYYDDTFCNLIIYDAKSGVSKKVNSNRLVGQNLSFNYFDDDILLVYEAIVSDSNNDGVLSFADLKQLYLYSFKADRLESISVSHNSMLSYTFLHESKDLLITLGIDKNDNGEFEADKEIKQVLRYSYANNQLVPLVNKALREEVQGIIDQPNKE